jgi:hypothetical protein
MYKRDQYFLDTAFQEYVFEILNRVCFAEGSTERDI